MHATAVISDLADGTRDRCQNVTVSCAKMTDPISQQAESQFQSSGEFALFGSDLFLRCQMIPRYGTHFNIHHIPAAAGYVLQNDEFPVQEDATPHKAGHLNTVLDDSDNRGCLLTNFRSRLWSSSSGWKTVS